MVDRIFIFEESKFLIPRFTKIVFVKDVSICFLSFVLSIFVINTGSEGPDLVDFLVDPKMF